MMTRVLAAGFCFTLALGGLGYFWQPDLHKPHPWSQQIIGWVNGLRYALLQTSDDQVHLGKDGWLYINQELRVPQNPMQNMQARAKAVIALAKSLQSRGTKLVVVVVPAKARIHPEHLGTVRFPKALESGYQDWVQTLQAFGVTTLRLDSLLMHTQRQTFLMTDTHWNTFGAQVAANGIAQRLGLSQQTRFATRTLPTQSLQGDLQHLMGVEGLSPPFRPADELETPSVTHSLAATNLGLFDLPKNEVVLVGTSYSLRSNFAGALSQALGVQVQNLAKEGSGFERNIVAFLKDPSLQEAPPKYLIWEFAERFLYLPIEHPLPQLHLPALARQEEK
jgi:alginate O-acetyltransferase complex protein AlgJ